LRDRESATSGFGCAMWRGCLPRASTLVSVGRLLFHRYLPAQAASNAKAP
jgi:hypothetical protein